MKAILNHNNEDQVAIAFNHQSAGFDDLYGLNTIIQYKRERVRERLLSYLKPESHILEINAGTGEDVSSWPNRVIGFMQRIYLKGCRTG